MQQALSFNDVSLVPVPVTNSPFTWLRSTEIARALGYSDERSVSRIYARNAGEFSENMTQVIEMSEGVNLTTTTRIFSLRGCHLLAMFSRTPVAKAFRKWVLDVLDRLAEEEQAALPHGDTLTATEQAQLHAIVSAKAGMLPADMQRKVRSEMWVRFNRHFRIARYAQLPPAKMGEAVEYLVGMEVKSAVPPALPAAKEPVHVFKRMGLTALEELQMGTNMKRMFDGLDVDKIGPHTMEALVLKAKYMTALSEIFSLNRRLVQDIDKIIHDINGPAMKTLNKARCFSGPVADTLYEPRYRLERVNEDYRAAALAALNSNICLAMMLGV